ncbi:hypothetical protein [Streptomyces mirabilis]
MNRQLTVRELLNAAVPWTTRYLDAAATASHASLNCLCVPLGLARTAA